MNRKWEVWNKKLATDLVERYWADPYKNTGRHYELIYRMCGLIEKGTILDVGSGTGHAFVNFLDRAEDYLGVDTSVSMREKAKGFFPEHAHRFQHGDIFNLSSIKPRNNVICVSVLIHLPDIAEPIKQLWSRAEEYLIFDHKIAEVHHLGKTPNYSGEIDKYLIRRQDTLPDVYSIFGQLENLGKIEHYHFDSASQIFKLTRGIPQPKDRDFNSWVVR
jgi:SAM-dependent methyltransferase